MHQYSSALLCVIAAFALSGMAAPAPAVEQNMARELSKKEGLTADMVTTEFSERLVDSQNVGWTVDGNNNGWTVDGNNYNWVIHGKGVMLASDVTLAAEAAEI
ncbi:hypothetical protein R3P38DRAFT_3263386 [Favolaschia claudopus]|uniref:Uncharacterized protein n=1 Tax=Favolaschia claudopus TaxID=2862362 RepID=A0AAW0CAI0_9AGAR